MEQSETWKEWGARLSELKGSLSKMRLDFSTVIIYFSKDRKRRKKAHKQEAAMSNAQLYNLALAQYEKYKATTGEADGIINNMLEDLDKQIQLLQEQKNVVQRHLLSNEKECAQWLEGLAYMEAKMSGRKATLPAFLQPAPKKEAIAWPKAKHWKQS